jgi:Protein of unknown function (DUF1266)
MKLLEVTLLAINLTTVLGFAFFWFVIYFLYTKFGNTTKNLLGKYNNTMNLKKENTLTSSQEWAIAAGANLSMINMEYLNALETGLGSDTCKKLLTEWWHISTKEKFIETADDLFNNGKRTVYNEALRAHYFDIVKKDKTYLNLLKEKYKGGDAYLIEDIKGNCIALVSLSRGLSLPYKMLKTINYEGQNFLAWDMCRLVNITRYACESKMINENEAWQIIMKAAKKIQQQYGSWEEMNNAYECGKYVWDSDAFTDQYNDGFADNLLMHNDSPFKKINWNLNLN